MMLKKINIWQIAGSAGTVICLGLFIKNPSFPTPDKLLIFLTFVFMVFGQAKEMLKRLLPFVALIIVYEQFRGLAHKLNDHVNYTFAPHFDKAVFGRLPTATLQQWLWKGHTSWYDVVFYVPYLLFFVVPLGLALLVWKTKDAKYWEVVTTYLVVFFAAFITFLLFPAAPPWMAAQAHVIDPITRVSTSVWFSLGIHDFPSLYNHIAPNPVAAVPSLHAAISTLTSLLVFRLYGRKWGAASLIYPLVLCFGVIYEGEHYFFDVLAGIIYAFAGFAFTPWLMSKIKKFSSSTKIVSKLAK